MDVGSRCWMRKSIGLRVDVSHPLEIRLLSDTHAADRLLRKMASALCAAERKAQPIAWMATGSKKGSTFVPTIQHWR